MPRISDSFTIRRSSPSIVTSVPDHLPNKIVSPVDTDKGINSPLSFLSPLPQATTVPSAGFSLALSGIIIPPEVVSSVSVRLISTRS